MLAGCGGGNSNSNDNLDFENNQSNYIEQNR
jgi:hypothetical protein